MIAPGEHEYVGDGETCRAAGCGRPPWLGQHRKPTEDIEQSIVDSTCSQEPAPPAPVSPKCEGWQHMEASEQEGIDPETFCDAYEASECKRPCPAGQCATRPGPGDLTPQGEPPAPDDAVREIARDEKCTREDIALSTPVDWSSYPKLAAIFQERPRINVYWAELARLAFDLTAGMHKRWSDEAYAAGRALGAKEEREACEKIARGWRGGGPLTNEIAAAIAARGSR